MLRFFVCSSILFQISLLGCSSNESPNGLFEKEKQLISEYERLTVLEKGKETYYIPKDDVNVIFRNSREIDVSDSRKGDNISFFDNDGNVIYQAMVIENHGSEIIIQCLDLSNAKYYITELGIDNIRDLDKDKDYTLKFYRNNEGAGQVP